MTQIAFLPLLRIQAGVQPNEDYAFSLYFYLSDGITPVVLTGITFALSLPGFSYSINTSSNPNNISIQGQFANCLSIFIPASVRANWYAAISAMTLTAVGVSGDTPSGIAPTVDVLGDSYLNNSPPSFQLTEVIFSLNTVYSAISPISPVLANALATISGVISSSTEYEVSASGPILAPGRYKVTAPGVTLTLPNPWLFGGSTVTVLDATGSSNPNILITGPMINTFTSNQFPIYQNGSVNFFWYPTSQAYGIV